MKSEFIKKYIDELNIESDSELSALKGEFRVEIIRDNSSLDEAIEILSSLSVELNERLEQVQDEDRITILKRKLELVEETGSGLEEIASKQSNEPAGHKTVLIADDSEERIKDTNKTIPVALDENDISLNKPSSKNSISHETDSEEINKKLEKEAAELIKQKQKEQKELEKEQKQKEDNEREESKDDSGNASSGNSGNTAGNSSGKTATGASAASNPNSSGNAGSSSSVASPSSIAASQSGQMDPRLGQALVSYYNKDLSRARQALKQLANARDLSNTDHGIAMFFYAHMLDKGEGGPMDSNAALFWMKSAAKLKNVDALLYVGSKYAESTPSNGAEDFKNTSLALKYFRKADNAQAGGNDTAKIKFVEVCTSKPVRYNTKRRAYKYCDDLANKATDGYEKQQYLDLKKKVKENKRIKQSSYRSGGVSLINGGWDICVLFGVAVTMLGIIYLFLTLQNMGDSLPNFLATKRTSSGEEHMIFQSLADHIEGMVANFSAILIEKELKIQAHGIIFLGFLMFVVGRILIGLQYASNRGKLTGFLCTVVNLATALMVFGNVVLYVFPGGSLMYLGAAIAVGLMTIAFILVTSVICYFIRNKIH